MGNICSSNVDEQTNTNLKSTVLKITINSIPVEVICSTLPLTQTVLRSSKPKCSS